jgi:hypothetical protein
MKDLVHRIRDGAADQLVMASASIALRPVPDQIVARGWRALSRA